MGIRLALGAAARQVFLLVVRDGLTLVGIVIGIGGGLILDGRPYRGWSGAAAELGHMVLDYGGAPCGQGCTGHGHFEALAAGKEIGRRLGAGLGSLVNIFDPEVIVLGGGFAEADEFVLGPARETLAVEALPPGRDHVRIEWAQLGPDAGMIGSALVGFEALDAEG